MDLNDLDQKLSLELFVSMYATTEVVASESILDFFNGVRDKIVYIANSIYNLNNDYITTEVNKYRHKTISVAKKIPMSSIANLKVAKPLNFRGLYVDYVPVISKASWVVLSDLTEFINVIIRQATSIINNSNSDLKTLNYLSQETIRNSEKIAEETRQNIAKFFPYNNNTTVALFQDLFISPNDFSSIFKEIDNIDECLSEYKIKKNISGKIDELKNLVNVIVDLEVKQRIFENHTSTKTSFVKALDIVAREIETLGYVYASVNFFYKALQEDCLSVVDFNIHPS